MTDSVPPSQVPQQQPPRGFTPEEIAYMKAQAMNEAVKRVGALNLSRELFTKTQPYSC